jgi:hypothetical protein
MFDAHIYDCRTIVSESNGKRLCRCEYPATAMVVGGSKTEQ